MEVWKNVERGYQVSSHGRIIGKSGRIIQGGRDKDGYAIISADTRTPHVKTLKVHRLVTEAFIGPIPEGYHVNHINGIKDDNRIDNLEIVTAQYNVIHGFEALGRVGRNTNPAKGSSHGNALLNEQSVREIRASYPSKTSRELAAKHNVSVSSIQGIVSRRSWKHVV
jgi:hypothetical protein